MAKKDKEVTVLDKIKELGLEDELPKEQPFDEEDDPPQVNKPKSILFSKDDFKSKLMIQELKQRDFHNIVTIAPIGKDLIRSVLDKLKQEKESDNVYTIAYLPLSNDDINRDESKIEKEIREINISVKEGLGLDTKVLAYFGDREDGEINGKSIIQQ